MMRSAACWLALLISSLAHGVEAQQGGPPRPVAAPDDKTVRTELAAVLLQEGRYEEAAGEYRVLVAREPRDFAARLGLARALAWGEHFREAELELRILRARSPSDREIAELLHSVRESLEPSSPEAAAWLAEQPSHVPYRRALARALVREGRARDALPHYDQLVALDLSPALVFEAAHAQIAAGGREGALRLLRGAVARAPADTAARHTLATVLVQTRQFAPALAHYDTLIAWHPGPELLLERGQLNLGRGDRVAAEADAGASIRAGPNVGAHLLRGDLRWLRGDLSGARFDYERARELRPNDRAISAALAQLMRDQRPIPAFVASEDHAAGWHLRSSLLSDNAGLTYATVGARQDVRLAQGILGSMDLEVRRLAERAADFNATIAGFRFGLGLSREISYGPFLARLAGRGGAVVHTDGSTLTGAVSAVAWLGAWGLSLEHARAPAYPSLLSAASVRSNEIRGNPLTEAITSVAVGGPVRSADIALSVQRAEISDSNRRSTVQAVLRFPLDPSLAVIYAGSGTWFAERSPLYWDPSAHIAGTAGLEYGTRVPHGFSFAARALLGPARSVEEIVRNRRRVDQVRSSLQVNGGVDLRYRSRAEELGVDVIYGSGRAGDYRRFEANVYVNLLR
jgi:thioredoxin-like negative regulator of GroEL